MRKAVCAVLFLVFCPFLIAQQSLNNDSIIKMVKAGLTDDVIVATINANSGAYDTSPDGLIALKQAGVSDKVIAAIVAKGSPLITVVPPPPMPPPAALPPGVAAGLVARGLTGGARGRVRHHARAGAFRDPPAAACRRS